MEDTVLTLLERIVGQNHHIYQDNYYNSVRLSQTFLDRNVRVCGGMRANRGTPRYLEGEGILLERGSQCSRGKVT